MTVTLSRIIVSYEIELAAGLNADKTAVRLHLTDEAHSVQARLDRHQTEWLIAHLQESLAKLSPPEKPENKG